VSENNEANRTNNNEAPSDEKPTTNDDRSSLERLAAFTKRILRVPKSELAEDDGRRTATR
jgi:hypothetical protein